MPIFLLVTDPSPARRRSHAWSVECPVNTQSFRARAPHCRTPGRCALPLRFPTSFALYFVWKKREPCGWMYESLQLPNWGLSA